MKKLIPVVFIFLVAVIFVFFPSDPPENTSAGATPGVLSNYSSVEDAIETLGRAKWRNTGHSTVQSNIVHLYSNGIITESQKHELEKRLDVENIKVLNQAALDFFVSGKDDGLGPIRDELARYSSDKNYTAQVSSMLTAANNYFRFLQFNSRISAMLRDKLDRSRLTKLRDEIASLANTDPLRRSSHVRALKQQMDTDLDGYVTVCLNFERDTLVKGADCALKYAKYAYYLNECNKRK
jgi:hypothetical protein